MKKFLGEGGKKKVYLALDSLLDREVAFALIKTEGLDETARVRVRREAQAMGRLGAHPHIVTVFDLGEIDGQPYMVTEFMGGGDVEHLIKKAENHRVPIERCLEIGRQVGMGLEFAHAKGIVHRDLKPGNVWLTGAGVAKIGDFGLALSLDRSRLTSEGMMVGTVSYMPPEQAMGGEVTPQADLYSLGAMLYEMVTGRPPFLGDDAVAVIGQHINTPPVAPSWHNPTCPRDLEALILRLLAKDPAQRPAHAGDVLTALAAVDVSAVAERTEAETRSLDSLSGGVFVGRQREMSELKAALEETLAGHGRLVMLVGEPGIGKTRTALELATYAGLRKAQVLWGRCYESQGTPPYWPWVQAIRSYVREHEPAELHAAMGAGAADIAEIVSDVRQGLPDLETPPALESPEAARFRLFDSIAAFLKSASVGQPLVLILDDLQWADKLTLLLLQFVAGELGTARVTAPRHVSRCGALAQAPVGAGVGRTGPRAGLPPCAAARLVAGGCGPFHRAHLRHRAARGAGQGGAQPDRGQPALRQRGGAAAGAGGGVESPTLARAEELERAHPGRRARGDRPAIGSAVRALQPGADHGGGAGPRVQLCADGEAGGRDERGAVARSAGGGDGGAGARGAAAAGGALPVHPCPDPGDAGG